MKSKNNESIKFIFILNIKYFIKNIFSFVFVMFYINTVSGQSLPNLPCYSISKQDGVASELYEYNPASHTWRNIGSTNSLDINSIAINPVTSKIYAVDGGTLGTINPSTAEFTPIGEIGIAKGAFGPIEINNVTGLSFHPFSEALYATHNIPGFAEKSNDLLLQIDVNTGSVIKEAMTDSIPELADYVRIEYISTLTSLGEKIRDVYDIAFDPVYGDLFAFQRQFAPAVLTQINPESGDIERVVNDVTEKNVASLGFDRYGDLYGTTYASNLNNSLSEFLSFELFLGTSQSLGPVDPSTNYMVSFICFDCCKEFQLINNCDINIDITNFSIADSIIQAASILNSNASIVDDDTITYKAGKEINLDAHFEISSGGVFSAAIENCP